MKTCSLFSSIASLVVLGSAIGAQPSEEKSVVRMDKTVTAQEEEYHASRGLQTYQGPTGMFLNPTSATLPKGGYTFQYCLFFPNSDTDIVFHGVLASYGITDWLELGVVSALVDVNDDLFPDEGAIRKATLRGVPISADKAGRDTELAVAGPMVRVRLLRDREWWPEVSIGGYMNWGTPAFNGGVAFVSASKGFQIDPKGFFKSVTLQSGFRETWFEHDQGRGAVRDSAVPYGGLELELPYKIYVIGEINRRNKDIDRRTPFAYGLQCRLPKVQLTLAAIQDGGQHDRIGIYSGIGISFSY